MQSWLTLASLLLVDVSAYQSIAWLREAVRISSEIDLPITAEVAFAAGGVLVLVGIPLAGWRFLMRAEDALPRARVIRY